MNHRIATARAAAEGQHGLTLIEIMVVLVLIGMITAVMAPNFLGLLDGGSASIARQQLGTVQGRLVAYKLAYGRYPSTTDGLQALVAPPAKASGRQPPPFLDDVGLLSDPWGNALVYLSPGREGGEYDLVSLGRDGVAGGDGADADIVVSR